MSRTRRAFELAKVGAKKAYEIWEMFSLNPPTHERDAARASWRDQMTRDLVREYSLEELESLLDYQSDHPEFDPEDAASSARDQLDRLNAIEAAIQIKRREI